MSSKLKLLTAVVITLFAAVFMYGCKQAIPLEVIGGIDSGNKEESAVITGARDLYIPAGAIGYDFLKEVEVQLSGGGREKPLCDTSAVRFDEAGEYTVTYSYGKTSVSKTVTIFTQPQMDISGVSDTFSYYQALLGFSTAAAATDCFGKALDVAVLNYGEVFNSDGSIAYGSHEVVFAAIDRAGNTATAAKTVQVTRNAIAEPAMAGSLSYDVIDDLFLFDANFGTGRLMGLSVGGRLLGADQYLVSGDQISVSGDLLVQTVSSNSVTVRIITEYGFCESALTITDDAEPELNVFGLDNWIYLVGSAGDIPKISRVCARQRFTLSVTLKNSLGTNINVSDGKFTPPSAGDYTITAVSIKADNRSYTKTLSVKAYAQSDYVKIVDTGASLQFAGSRIAKASGNVQGFGFDYTEEDIGGRTGVYKMIRAQGEVWYNRVEFTTSYKDSIAAKFKDYTKLCMDVFMVTPMTDPYVGLNAVAYYYSYPDSTVRIYDPVLEQYVKYSDSEILAGRWVVLEIDLSKYKYNDSYNLFTFGISSPQDCIVYYSNFRFV